MYVCMYVLYVRGIVFEVNTYVNHNVINSCSSLLIFMYVCMYEILCMYVMYVCTMYVCMCVCTMYVYRKRVSTSSFPTHRIRHHENSTVPKRE